VSAGLSALQHAKRAGDLLRQARAHCEHGSWLPWLREHCPSVSPRTAQAYMRIAREWPTLEAKAQRVAYLPVREALDLLADHREREREPDDVLTDAAAIDAASAQIHVQLTGCRAVLDRDDATVEELCAVIDVARACELQATEIRIRAERGLGQCIEWTQGKPVETR
jgi:hypothetical protein